MKTDIIRKIRKYINQSREELSNEKKNRMYRIINPDTENYQIYGIRVAKIDNIVKKVSDNYNCVYDDAVEVFKELISSNIEEEKFAAFLF